MTAHSIKKLKKIIHVFITAGQIKKNETKIKTRADTQAARAPETQIALKDVLILVSF